MASPLRVLPNIGEYFATEVALAGLPIGHQPLAGADDGDAEAVEHAWHSLGRAINFESGARNTFQALDDLLTLGTVLVHDPHLLLGSAERLGLEGRDEALVAKHFSNL